METTFTDLLKTLNLIKIQCLETSTKRLADPVPGKEFEYTVQQLLGTNNPELLSQNQALFRVQFIVTFQDKDGLALGVISIAHGVLFEVLDQRAFDQLWNQEPLRDFFNNQQLRKTLWLYVRQFVFEGLARLELPPVTLPWIL